MKQVLLGFFLFGFLLCLGTGLLIYAAVSAQPEVASNSVLMIELDGPLQEGDAGSLNALVTGAPPASFQSVTHSIREAATDTKISGLVLNIITPQIGHAQLHELEETMKVFRDSGKWSLAYLETAGSQTKGDGAYALALSADEVILSPPGSLNLIGLRAEVPFFAELLERLKIQPHIQKRKEYKSGANIYTQKAFTGPHEEALKEVVDDLQANLYAHIAARRKVNLETAKEWVQTGPHSSTTATDKGMIDNTGYWDQVLDTVQERTGREDSTVSLRDYYSTLSGSSGDDTLAVITAVGEIHRGKSDGHPFAARSTIGSITYQKAFQAARADKVKGVLFRINSPGGSYIASDMIRREVELTRKAGVPVVVSMGDVAGSGGYFIAMDADHILAAPSTITGSIGVYGGGLSFRTFLHEFLGITFDTYQSTPNADTFSQLDPPDAHSHKATSETMDRIYHDFVSKVAAGRGKSYDDAEASARGRIWSGQDALKLGLVDELGGYYAALSRLKEKAQISPEAEVQLKTYPVPDTPINALRKTLASGANLTSVVQSALKRFTLALDTSSHAQLKAPEVPVPY